MKVQKITVDDFKKISKNDEYFLWSFLIKEQHLAPLPFWSVLEGPETHPKHKTKNQIVEFLDLFPIQLYESYTEENVDFLMDLGIHHKNIYNPEVFIKQNVLKKNHHYFPIVILFKGWKLLDTTLNHCYCIEGITKMLINNAPKFVEELNLN